MDQDRTRRALSDKLISFLSRSFHSRQDSEILQKQMEGNVRLFKKAVPIRPKSGLK